MCICLVFWSTVFAPLKVSNPWAFGLKYGGCKYYIGEDKYRKKKKKERERERERKENINDSGQSNNSEL